MTADWPCRYCHTLNPRWGARVTCYWCGRAKHGTGAKGRHGGPTTPASNWNPRFDADGNPLETRQAGPWPTLKEMRGMECECGG